MRRDRHSAADRSARGCVGDVRYSLLCVHWAQCKGALTRAGSAPRPSPAAPTWTFTCARTQASGPISATPVSSASRRSPASIYIRGRTQVGTAGSRAGLAPRPPHVSLHSHSASPPNLCLFFLSCLCVLLFIESPVRIMCDVMFHDGASSVV